SREQSARPGRNDGGRGSSPPKEGPLMARKYDIISADTHILEPPDIWKNHLPAKYQDDAPRLVKDHEGGDAWQFGNADPDPIGLVSTPGKRFDEFKWWGVSYDEIRPAVFNGKE